MATAAPGRTTPRDAATAPTARAPVLGPLNDDHDRLKMAYRDFPQLGEAWRILVGGRERRIFGHR
jgi:hypothetical protein